MTAPHRATLERLMAEIWNKRRLDLMPEIFREDVTIHRGADLIQGLAEFRDKHVAPFQAAFPDLHHDADEILVEGDKAALRFHGTGTQAQDFAGFPASNRKISYQATGFFRFEDGLVAEVWVLSSIGAALAAAAQA